MDGADVWAGCGAYTGGGGTVEVKGLTVKVSITETELWQSVVGALKDLMDDARVPQEVKDELQNKIFNKIEQEEQ